MSIQNTAGIPRDELVELPYDQLVTSDIILSLPPSYTHTAIGMESPVVFEDLMFSTMKIASYRTKGVSFKDIGSKEHPFNHYYADKLESNGVITRKNVAKSVFR